MEVRDCTPFPNGTKFALKVKKENEERDRNSGILSKI
jgi:hypothetical protein